MPTSRSPVAAPRISTDVRGGVRLAVEGVQGVVDIVESMHQRIASLAPPLGTVPDRRTSGITGFVYRRVRGTTRLVGSGLDLALAAAERLVPGATQRGDAPQRDAVVAALNGICGDHLHRTGNPLAVTMELRPAAGATPSPHLLVLVHGLCMTGSQWDHRGHDHGMALGDALKATPVYASYNSGRHIAVNGAELAGRISELVASWPVPVASVTLIGHSMGGLVARSAVARASGSGMPWAKLLRAMVFLGTPHHGAPLERGGNWVHRALGVSPYVAPFARLAGLRSEGITDLRHGNLHGAGTESRFAPGHVPAAVPLPVGVACYAIAGSLRPAPLGDGLVTVASALGRAESPERDLALPANRVRVIEDCGHLDLLHHPEAFGQMRQWLVGERAPNQLL
ncbi:alpha/beta hydrolase [Caenimonas sedimenti]|uniref:Alpha/beta hydrolase n=1 Tax=Caenimonas sedimenti TaxID=2596921 RepID=A0A562ZP59_9BURK|nr:alpha/beta fold hydrolase [Caenimonas sedimenti]TWO70333.1 alpha/beta hydrolase [Caenimonas sedimenti]